MKLKRYIIILIILFLIIFIILKINKLDKNIFNDIMIFGLWNDESSENEYEIDLNNLVEIDVFENIHNKNNIYKKIAPGTYGSFTIKFKKPLDSDFEININEKSEKPQNLIFTLDNKNYKTMKEMEDIISSKFETQKEITINWYWKYEINEMEDIQDTIDGMNLNKYVFEIKATTLFD